MNNYVTELIEIVNEIMERYEDTLALDHRYKERNALNGFIANPTEQTALAAAHACVALSWSYANEEAVAAFR